MRRSVLGTVVAALLGAGCIPELEGAPCSTDDNCPADQRCGLERRCVRGERDGGGVDGGGVDGGGVDGGGVDGGGVDGGGVDGGGVDGGGGDGGGGDGGDADASVGFLAVDRAMVDFGDVTLLTTSGAQVVTIANTGSEASGALSVQVTGAQAARFRVFSTTCTSALGAGASCQVTLVFEPTVEGTVSATLEVAGMPGGVARSALAGRGRAAAQLSLTPAVKGFGVVVLGQTASHTFRVMNTGGSPTGLVSASVSGADGSMFIITMNGCAAPLAPGAWCDITVTFGPPSAGVDKEASLTVSASPGGVATAGMTGSAQTPASLTGMPSPGVFAPTAVGSPMGPTVVFTILNQGQASTPPLTTSISGAEFKKESDSCNGQVVSGMASCAVELRFQPAASGSRSGVLTVGGAGLLPVVIPLAGTGQTPAALTLSTTMLSFGSVASGSTSTAVIGVSNTGESAMGMPSFTTMGMGFSVVSNTCGASVASGTNCSVTVRFSPTSAGPFNGTFSASANPGGTASATLSGAGTSGGGALTINPAVRDFGNVLIGASAQQDFTVLNTGASSLTIAFTLEGANPGSFTVSNNLCGGMLNGNASCGFRITFAPTTAGARSAFVKAAAGAAVAQATLAGNGQRPAALSVSPASFVWPNTVINSTGSTTTFTVKNTGDVATGAVMVSLGGADSSQFALGTNGCASMPLGPQGSCQVQVLFAPLTVGAKVASLVATNPDGLSGASLTGTAVSQAQLTLMPSPTVAFGDVPTGQADNRNVTVQNTGGVPSGPLGFSVSGTDAALFQTQTVAGGCQPGQPLAANSSCVLRVLLSAGMTPGMKTATLTVSGMPGGMPSVSLAANVLRQAQLSSGVTQHNFDGVEVGQPSTPFVWTVQNSGGQATGALMLVNTNTAEFAVSSNTCTGALAAGANCQVTVRLSPSAGGSRSGTLTLSGMPGGSVSLAMTGKGQWRLTLEAAAPAGAMGITLSTTDGLLSCGVGGCSRLYDDGAAVTVKTRTTNGSGLHFASWEPPSPQPCRVYGKGNTCEGTMTAAGTAKARFQAIDVNLAFVSSTTFPANLGSLDQYDDACNTLASDAGINNMQGKDYVAWMSTGAQPAVDNNRLRSGAGAFRRLDGSLVATNLSELRNGKVLSPLSLDEFGKLVPPGVAWTGTKADGSAATNHCSNWTSTLPSFQAMLGEVRGGPVRWSEVASLNACANTYRIYCFMKASTASAPLSVVPGGAKIAYVTQGATMPLGNLAAMDGFCNANKPSPYAGRTFVALLATTTASAGSRLDAAAQYYRPDGLLIGSGAEIRSGTLRTGIWQTNLGNYVENDSAWTGASDVQALATSTSNCSDWSSTAGAATAVVGFISHSAGLFFSSGSTGACNGNRRVYCVQSSP
jgi:hypothetical protein